MFFEPEKCQRDIENFKSTMYDCLFQLKSAGLDLFTILYDSWCSPRAVEFSKKYSSSLYYMTVGDFQFKIDTIYQNMIVAYNTIARANNYPELPFDGMISGDLSGDFGTLREYDSNYAVGMNINVVKQAVNEYQNTVKSVCNIISNYNFGLAFHDDKGLLISAQQILKKKVESISENIGTVFNDLNVYTQYESNRVDLAASQAADTMSA